MSKRSDNEQRYVKTLLQCLIPFICALDAALWEKRRMLDNMTVFFHFIIFFGGGVLMVLSWRFMEKHISNDKVRMCAVIGSVILWVSIFAIFNIKFYV